MPKLNQGVDIYSSFCRPFACISHIRENHRVGNQRRGGIHPELPRVIGHAAILLLFPPLADC